MSGKIVLNLEIDGNKFDGAIDKIFKNLTKEQSFELATKCLTEFFNTIEPVKFYDYEKRIVEILKDTNGYRYSSTKDIQQSSGYKDMLKELSSTKKGMLNIIKQDTIEHAKNIIDSYVKSDVDVKGMIDSVLADLDNNIGNLINDAVARHIADSIGFHLNDFRNYVLNNITEFNKKLGGLNG